VREQTAKELEGKSTKEILDYFRKKRKNSAILKEKFN